MHVIGTAGHVDHGKSTLIRALTGIDPDRLKEEKERGMTIDLGFAWLSLPSGREVGIVDVPGHQRFIRNMLAGVGGIDFTLLVVAANEGWMPQTEEHVQILAVLGVERGAVVLTKSDLVEAEWLDVVAEDVRDRLAHRQLAAAPLFVVSAATGAGLAELTTALDALLREMPPPADRGRPRLWVDRVFSVHGAGTIVTGTLSGGPLTLDEAVEVLPAGLKGRVRGLQTHRRSVERATPGERVAVNLAGIEADKVQRGMAVVLKDQYPLTGRINATLRAVDGLGFELPARAELKLHLGAAEQVAKVRLLDREALFPGEKSLVQIELSEPLPIEYGDRFVLRDATRQATVGGGRVLDALAVRLRGPKLRLVGAPAPLVRLATAPSPPTLDLAELAGREQATASELVLAITREQGFVTRNALGRALPFSAGQLRETCDQLAAAGRLIALHDVLAWPGAWQAWRREAESELESYHCRFPLRPGLLRETLRTGFGMEPRLFDQAIAQLASEGAVVDGAHVRLPGHAVRLNDAQQALAERVLARLRRHPLSPPDWDEVREELGIDVELLSVLVERGDIVKVGKGILYAADVFAALRDQIVAWIKERGSIDVAELRDLLGSSRKYAVPLLEHLDTLDVTRRVGDRRHLGRLA